MILYDVWKTFHKHLWPLLHERARAIPHIPSCFIITHSQVVLRLERDLGGSGNLTGSVGEWERGERLIRGLHYIYHKEK